MDNYWVKTSLDAIEAFCNGKTVSKKDGFIVGIKSHQVSSSVWKTAKGIRSVYTNFGLSICKEKSFVFANKINI